METLKYFGFVWLVAFIASTGVDYYLPPFGWNAIASHLSTDIVVASLTMLVAYMIAYID